MRRLVLAFLLLAAGCSTLPVPRPEHGDRVADCSRWTLGGRIGVIRDGEGWHGGIEWRQTGARYRVSLRGPLGQGGLLVIGGPDEVRIVPAEGAPVSGKDIDRLVARMLGWPLPVSGLRYWIRGRSAPGAGAEVERDARGLPRSIRQDGWTLLYSGWIRNPDGTWWPTRIQAIRDDLKLKLVTRRQACHEAR